MVTFTIPFPPSVNAMFANIPGKGRIKTAKYKAWIDTAGWIIRAQKVPYTSGPVSISLVMKRPNAASDVDNRQKAAIDLCVKMGLIDDDKHVMSVSAAWGPVEDCQCTIQEYHP